MAHKRKNKLGADGVPGGFLDGLATGLVTGRAIGRASDITAGLLNGSSDGMADDPAKSGFGVSRSKRKRDSAALQLLGERLLALSSSFRARLPLPPDLAQALAAHSGIKTHEAKRRQMQYIGRLMREAYASGELGEITRVWEQLLE